jgi:hypothetical protein
MNDCRKLKKEAPEREMFVLHTDFLLNLLALSLREFKETH